nr:unnamed protein product [Callosobruchus analis]
MESSQSNQPTHYSTIASTYKHPSKEQAIIFNSIDGARIQDYLLQLGPIIQPKNILFCSRISNNRICIYLSSKDLVNDFIKNRGEITVLGEKVKARKLVTPSDRLVLSNVCPTIPHIIVKNQLQQLGLTLLSPITFLRIGATVAEYSHILSFRRQVYIAPLDTDTLPESIEINHDGLSYRIFMTLDSQKCYKCNLTGHIASQCRSTHNAPTTSHSHIQESQQSTPEIQPHQNIQTSSSEHTILSQSATNDIALAKEDIDTTRSTQKIPNAEPATTDLSTSSKTSNKRSVSEILSPTAESTPTQDTTSSPTFAIPNAANTPKTKKHKPEAGPATIQEESLSAVKAFIENHSPPLVLNTNQLKSLLENTHGVQDITSIINDYTRDIKGLIEMLLLIYPHILDRTLKNRCTRLRKKLERHFDQSLNESFSDTSSVDSSIN